FTKPTPGEVRDVVAQTPANRSPHQHLRKTVRPEKRAMSKHARQKERDVSFDHDENENCVKPVLKQQIVKKVEVHEETKAIKTSKYESQETKISRWRLTE